LSGRGEASGAAILVADSVGKSFGRKQVLKAATLTVPRGRVTALLGRNGSGKTTLLRIAAGRLRPDFGTVRIDGEICASPRLPRLGRRGLFFLPERGLLPPWPKVGQLVATVSRRYDGPDAERLVRTLDLDSVARQRVRQLSGGERRRVELAVAAARSPRILLADEPFLGIPPTDRQIVARELRKLADAGCATVVTGHEVEGLLELSDGVTWLTGGTTRWLGTPEEAARYPEFRVQYLGLAADSD
jgi:ABC-type multidrug transport system ATPase subunit